MTPVAEVGQSVNRTTTGDVFTGNGRFLGFYVNSTTAGTVIFRQGGSGGTVLNGVITPAVGFHRFPIEVTGGLHVTVGGTLDATFFYQPE